MSNTFTFNQLLPNFDAFKVFVSEIPMDVSTMSELEISILEHCYNLLNRRYGIANVRYTTPEAFYNELAIVFDDEYKKYSKRYKLIQEAYALTSDDLIEINRTIQNYANNPNTAPTNPLDPLEFISSQTYQVGRSNKLQGYLMAIESLPSQYDEDFLNKFKYLFIQIFNKDIPIYIG